MSTIEAKLNDNQTIAAKVEFLKERMRMMESTPKSAVPDPWE